MSNTSSGTGYLPAPVDAPRRVRGRRTSRAALSLAIALVVVCGLAVVGLVSYARGGTAYLALARQVAFGARIQNSDVTIVRLNDGSGLSPVSASKRNTIVGRYATMPLAAGTLLTRSQTTVRAIPGPGKQVVSVTLQAERAPAHPLTPGMPVNLIRTPDENATTPSDDAQPLSPIPGTVRAVRTLQYGAGVVVDVIVESGDAPAVASAASAERIAIAVRSGG